MACILWRVAGRFRRAGAIDACPQCGLFLPRWRDKKSPRQRAAIAPDQSDGVEGGTQGLALHRVRYYRQPHLPQQLYQGRLPALPARIFMGVAQHTVLAQIPQELISRLEGHAPRTIFEWTIRPVAKRPSGFLFFRGALQTCVPVALVDLLE